MNSNVFYLAVPALLTIIFLIALVKIVLSIRDYDEFNQSYSLNKAKVQPVTLLLTVVLTSVIYSLMIALLMIFPTENINIPSNFFVFTVLSAGGFLIALVAKSLVVIKTLNNSDITDPYTLQKTLLSLAIAEFPAILSLAYATYVLYV